MIKQFYLSVGELVALLEGGGRGGGGHLLLEVEGDIAELLLDVTYNLTLDSCCEAVVTLSEDLHKVISQVTSSQIHTKDSMGKSITCNVTQNV